MNKTMIKTAAATLIALALIFRFAPAKEALTGETKLFGIF